MLQTAQPRVVSFVKTFSVRDVLLALALAFLLMLERFQSYAQSLNLEIDATPLFSSISDYLPVFFGVLAIAGGILIAKKIAEFIIKSIADAF